jgi:8-oxo-dGTP pyrophosphatase MutT (NUDIX family)
VTAGTGENQIVAVAIAIFRGDRVLAMRRAPGRDAGAGLWETISGRIAPGEDPLAAIEREVREECGLEVRIDPRPVEAYAARRGEQPMTVIFFRGTHVRGEVVRSEEHDQHAWLTVDELAERSTLVRLVEAVRRAAMLPSG